MDIRIEIGGNIFVWDLDKAAKNLRKHGIRFEEAAAVFGDPSVILVDASRNEEARYAAIGFDAGGRLLYVVHIEIEAEFIRIISARQATQDEEQRYVV